MKNIYLLFFLFCTSECFSQKQNMLSFEFSYGVNHFNMENLNRFYIDSFAKKENIGLLKNHIKQGQQYYLSLNYRPIGLFDIGIYGGYQFGKSKHQPTISETDENGFLIQEHSADFEIKTKALLIGVSSTWYISHLLKFQDKENVLNRLHIGIELNTGIGFSSITAILQCETFPIVSNYGSFNSNNFHGQIGLKTEYNFTKSPFLTTLGIKAGYQYLKTKIVRDRYKNEWIVSSQPINLDFSGFYLGAYMKFGK